MATIYDFTVNDIHGKTVKLDRYKGKVDARSSTRRASAASRRSTRASRRCTRSSTARGSRSWASRATSSARRSPAARRRSSSSARSTTASRFRCSRRSTSTATTRRRCTSTSRRRSPGCSAREAIKWNFTKFLVDRKGNVVERYAPNDDAGDRSPATSRSALMRVALRAVRDRLRRWRVAARVSPRRRSRSPTRTRCCASRFRSAETGFDPQAAGDVYSNYVNRAIFDRCTGTTTSRARTSSSRTPRSRCPRSRPTARTWTIRIKPGIYFADDPGVQGPEARAHRRRLRLFDGSACSTRRCARNSLQSSSTAGSSAWTRVVAKAKETRQVRLRRADRRAAGDRPLHAPAQAQLRRLRAAVRTSRPSPPRRSRAR